MKTLVMVWLSCLDVHTVNLTGYWKADGSPTDQFHRPDYVRLEINCPADPPKSLRFRLAVGNTAKLYRLERCGTNERRVVYLQWDKRPDKPLKGPLRFAARR